MSLPQAPTPCPRPRFERTGLAAPLGVELNELQGYILLLTGKPHTLTYLINAVNTLTNDPTTYARIWLEITRLRKLGLLVMYPPLLAAPALKLPAIPNYQSSRRYAA